MAQHLVHYDGPLAVRAVEITRLDGSTRRFVYEAWETSGGIRVLLNGVANGAGATRQRNNKFGPIYRKNSNLPYFLDRQSAADMLLREAVRFL